MAAGVGERSSYLYDGASSSNYIPPGKRAARIRVLEPSSSCEEANGIPLKQLAPERVTFVKESSRTSSYKADLAALEQFDAIRNALVGERSSIWDENQEGGHSERRSRCVTIAGTVAVIATCIVSLGVFIAAGYYS